MPQSGNLPVLFLLSSQKSTFCHLAENYELDRKMDGTFYDGHDELYHHAKLGGGIEQRAPAVGAKMWCFFVCFFVCLSRSESGAPCVRGSVGS